MTYDKRNACFICIILYWLFLAEIHLFDFNILFRYLDICLGCLVTASFLDLIGQLVTMKTGWMIIQSDIGISPKLHRLSTSTTC